MFPGLNLRRIHGAGIVIVWALTFAITGCDSGPAQGPTSVDQSAPRQFTGEYPIQVVCTTGPVGDLIRNLGGEHLEVTTLMGPGVDPHLYTAVPADIERLLDADMIFYNGLHLEGRMADRFEELRDKKPTFAVTHGLVEAKDPRLRKPPEFEGYFDPHVWHDPELWAECAKYVAAVLAEFDPEHRREYEKRRDEYVAQLKEVDQYATEQLGGIPAEQRVLVSAHDAFNYFCEAYDLTSMPLKGVSTEEEVTIGRMNEVIEFLVERKVKAVFVESATSPQTVRALIERCREAGHEVRIGRSEDEMFMLYADALGPEASGADTYVGMFRTNVDTIVSALK